jgi:hypothetical protein
MVVVAAFYTKTISRNQFHGTSPLKVRRTKKPYREKSVNDTSNELRKPFQGYLITMSRLISDLYLALPRFVSGPLQCNND